MKQRWCLTIRPAFLSTVLAVCSLATSCFMMSRIVLTPSPNTPPSPTMPSLAVSIVDSLARRHGLKREQETFPCSVGSSQGKLEGYWTGWLLLTVCVERAHPDRVEVYMNQRGLSWSAEAQRFRRELSDALGTRFGAAVVTVDPK